MKHLFTRRQFALSTLSLLGLFIDAKARAAETIEENGFSYEVVDGEAIVTGYTDSTTELFIPEELNGHPVVGIKDHAFSCFLNSTLWGLRTISFPISLEYIGEGAFESSRMLQHVDLTHSNLKSIGQLAFSWCNSLTDVSLPASVQSIGEGAFSRCDSLASIRVDPANEVYASSVGGVLFEKATETLVQFPAGMPIKSYSAPEGMRIVGARAFEGCSRLASINLPSSLKSVEDYAFDGCTSLTRIELQDLESIGNYAFSGCDSLTEVSIPLSVKFIGCGPFAFCDSLASIQVDSTHEEYASIGGVLFEKATKTIMQYPAGMPGASYIVPEGIRHVGAKAFAGCSRLTSIELPSSLESIEDYAIQGCDSLEFISFPTSLKSIGNAAFYRCMSLSEIYIPAAVDTINPSAFRSCPALRSIEVNPNNATYAVVAEGLVDQVAGAFLCLPAANSFMLYIVSAGIIDIAPYAFDSCTHLTSVELPDTVTRIGEGAFSGCDSLESISMPNSLVSIDDYAFIGCHSLRSVTIPESVEFIGSKVFPDETSLIVTKGSYAQEWAAKNNMLYDFGDWLNS